MRTIGVFIIVVAISAGTQGILLPLQEDRAFHFSPEIQQLLTSRQAEPLAPRSPNDIKDDIEKAVQATMKIFNITGAAVGVIQSGKVVYSGGFGYANWETKTKVDDTTLFQIASNSKAFTAMTALTLVEKGQMSLDVPVRNYLPSFRLKDNYASESITLRDLLSHRTGMPRHDAMWTINTKTRDEFMATLGFLDADKPARYHTEYNNFMFLASGQAVAQVAGASWDEVVQTNIFDKLGMGTSYPTYAAVPADQRSKLATPYGSPSDDSGHAKVPVMLADDLGPAGSIVSNVQDMLKWIGALNQMAQGQTRTVNSTTFKQMLTPVALFPAANSFGCYSLGLWVEPWAGTMIVHHGGNLNGMSSQTGWFPLIPGGGHGLVILTNQDSSPAPSALAYKIADILLNLKSPDYDAMMLDGYLKAVAERKRQEAEIEKKIAEGHNARYPNAAYVGVYRHVVYGVLNVTLSADGKSLRCEIPNLRLPKDQQTFNLRHWWYDTFALQFRGVTDADVQMDFLSDDFAHVVAVQSWQLEPTVAPIVFTNDKFKVTTPLGMQWPAACSNPYMPKTADSDNYTADLTRGSLWSVVLLTCVFSSITFAGVFGLMVFCCGKRLGRQLIANEPLASSGY